MSGYRQEGGWYQPGTTPWALVQMALGLLVTGAIVGAIALVLVLPFLVWVALVVVGLLAVVALGVLA